MPGLDLCINIGVVVGVVGVVVGVAGVVVVIVVAVVVIDEKLDRFIDSAKMSLLRFNSFDTV